MGLFFESLIFDTITLLTTLTLALYLYVQWKFNYWTRKGVPSLEPSFPFGNIKDMVLGRRAFGAVNHDFYKQFRAQGCKHGGIYRFLQPTYFPLDPEILKHILQKDFQHFVNHGIYMDKENDPLTGHLFNLEDDEWRQMRIHLTPTFTSGKMKMMFQTFIDCAVGLKDIIGEAADNHTPVDIKDVLARFTTDIIGSVAFGVECNSLKNPNAEFRKYGKKIFEIGSVDRLKLFMMLLLPLKWLHFINFKRSSNDVEKFFMGMIRDTVNHREKNNLYRKDFLHMLIQLKNRGKVADDGKLWEDGARNEKTLTMNELAAQAFVFFIAGYETSSTTMTFACYELAINPDVQEQLREEINSVLAKHDSKLTYAAISEMKYLEKILQETLRKHPPVGSLPRVCNKDYKIPKTNVLLEKGTKITISVIGLHYDPEYYPNPEIFDPERFTEENKKSRPDCTWIPFGDGPRQCIGLRFGMLQAKVGLVTLLRSYKITLNEKTKVPLELDTKALVTSAKGGVWLDVKKIST